MVPVGQSVCLSGQGPHYLTFCKPGNNPNAYIIRSVPGFYRADDAVVRIGCSVTLQAMGITPATAVWQDITGAGVFNNLLSCTSGCNTTLFTPVAGVPSYIEYQVCGHVFDTICNNFFYVCDTIGVSIYPELSGAAPDTLYYCESDGGILLSAHAVGGNGIYSYQWRDANGHLLSVAPDFFAQAGVYYLEIRDGFPDCPPYLSRFLVNSDQMPMVDPGIYSPVCVDYPVVQLQGMATGVAGGVWSGGKGVFVPDTTDLHAIYIPHPDEIHLGHYTLVLTSVADTVCPAVSRQVSFTFTDSILPVVSWLSHVQCHGGNDGAFMIEAGGGLPPYSFSLDGRYFQASGEFSGLAAGSYIVYVRDSLGCSVQHEVSVLQPDVLYIDSVMHHVSCFGANDGRIEIIPSGGTPPYHYSWSNGFNVPTIDHLTAGNYVLTVADRHGCMVNGQFIITEPSSMEVSHSVIPPSCNSMNDGSIEISVVGGTPPFRFFWLHGDTSARINGLRAGVYPIVILDAHQCTQSVSVELDEPDELVMQQNVIPVSCFGFHDGSIDVAVSGGSPPYRYQWSDGDTSAFRYSLAEGRYALTIADNHGCEVSADFQISQPDSLVITATVGDVSCFNSHDGFIFLQVEGGMAPYHFIWSDSIIAKDRDNLTAGTYWLTLTDRNGCGGQAAFHIGQPEKLIADIEIRPITCFGYHDGSLIAHVSGGTVPYSFHWSNGSQAEALTHVAAGFYALTITDGQGCVIDTVAEITQPDSLYQLAVVRHVSCYQGNDGAISVRAMGGVSPYHYQWSDGSTQPERTDLPAGVYTLTIVDDRHCQLSAQFSIEQNPPIEVELTGTPLICKNSSQGNITAQVRGGNPPYILSWSHATHAVATLYGLSAGVYTLSVIDRAQCSSEASFVIEEYDNAAEMLLNKDEMCQNEQLIAEIRPLSVYAISDILWDFGDGQKSAENPIIHQYVEAGIYTITAYLSWNNGCVDTIRSPVLVRPLPVADAGPDVATCPGQAVILRGSGGIDYEWIPRGDTTVLSPRVNIVMPTDTTYYVLRVVDFYGCSDYDTVWVHVYQTGMMQAVSDTLICPGGYAPLSARGGISYLWMPADGLSCTNCDAPIASPLFSQSYVVIARDQNGCMMKDTVHVYVAPRPRGIISRPDTVCANTPVSLLAEEFHRYEWAPAAYLSSTDIHNPVAIPVHPTTFRVTVTNVFGCSIEDSVMVHVFPSPTPIVPDTVVLCAGDTAWLEVEDDYSYQWHPIDGLSCNDCSHPAVFPLHSIWYRVTITSADGCVRSDSVYVRVKPLPQVTVRADLTICRRDSVELRAAVIGDDVQVAWYPDMWLLHPNQSATLAWPPMTTRYFVRVTDAFGCSSSDSLTVQVIEEVSVEWKDTIRVCRGQSVTLRPDTLIAPDGAVVYRWLPSSRFPDNRASEQTIIPRQDETVVLIVESGACKPDTQRVFIDVMPVPSVSVRAPEYVITGQSFLLGAAAFRAETYQWQPDSLVGCAYCAETHAAVSYPTLFRVVVTASNGCIAEDSALIRTVPDCASAVFLPNSFTPNGDEINDRFCIRSSEVYGIRIFRIFNRWGQLVFETDNIFECWDGNFKGKPVNPDVYVYYVEGLCANGLTKMIKGNVTVIR